MLFQAVMKFLYRLVEIKILSITQMVNSLTAYLKACLNGSNIVGQNYYNRYDCFSFKSFWLDKLYSNSKPSLDKKFEKETVWAIISTMLDDVGPTMLDPFKQALKDD